MAIPLTVIGGFLGAGKTTLLNRVLAGNSGVRYGVMVNDFGDLAVDAALVTGHDGETLSFANGCVCCTLGDDFLISIDQLLARPEPPEQILVEASGVADPRAIADMAELHPGLRRDLTLVLVDAGAIRRRADDARLSETVARQLAAADLIILNKCDLIDTQARAHLKTWLGRQTPAAVVETEQARLPLEILAGTLAPLDRPAFPEHHHHGHGDIFTTYTLEITKPLDLDRLRALLSELPPSVLRIKGFVPIVGKPAQRCLVQWSGASGDLQEIDAGNQHPALVVIGTTDMPSRSQMENLFMQACHGADH